MGAGVPKSDLPATIDIATRIVFQLGVPTVFAGVLLYFVIFKIQESLDSLAVSDLKRTYAIEELRKEWTEIGRTLLSVESERHQNDRVWRDDQLQELRKQSQALDQLLKREGSK